MPLQRSVLTEGFTAAAEKNRQAYREVEAEIKKLRADIGQSLSAERFQEEARKIAERKTESMQEKTLDRYAAAIQTYLNGMQDPFGDPLMKPFTKAQARSLVEPMAQSESGINVPAIDAQVQSNWASFFPLKFQLSTPPPGSVQKTDSTGALVPMKSAKPVVKGDHDSFDQTIEALADLIHDAASQVTVTVQHLISTPSGPTPGPPIVKPVR